MEKYTWQFISKAAEPMLHRILWDTPEEVLPGSVLGPEVRNMYLIECNVSGYGRVIVNGKEFKVTPERCYILRPGDEVTMIADEVEPRHALWCMFGGAKVGEILNVAGITDSQPFVPDELFPEMLAILERLHSIKNLTDMGSELTKTAYLYELLGVLTRGRTDVTRNLLAERAVSIMETEYFNDISVSYIASELGFDRSYFSTAFKESTGLSPYSYLTRIRIRRACDHLARGRLPIGEIAERVGIDPHNFSRIFKRETGLSPIDYQKTASKDINKQP